jgi:hypothetical protein
MHGLVYLSVLGRCPCLPVRSYAWPGVSLGNGPMSLCACSVLCMAWCIPRWWADVPVFLCSLMHGLVYLSVLGRCPCVLVRPYAWPGVSLGNGPMSLCACSVLCMAWCISRWWADVSVFLCGPMHGLVYLSVMGTCLSVCVVMGQDSLNYCPLSLFQYAVDTFYLHNHQKGPAPPISPSPFLLESDSGTKRL